jgi:hypothetical protein
MLSISALYNIYARTINEYGGVRGIGIGREKHGTGRNSAPGYFFKLKSQTN